LRKHRSACRRAGGKARSVGGQVDRDRGGGGKQNVRTEVNGVSIQVTRGVIHSQRKRTTTSVKGIPIEIRNLNRHDNKKTEGLISDAPAGKQSISEGGFGD